MQKLIWLALAGSLGTLSRFLAATLATRWFGHGFPWGTLVVNLVGCFLFGLVLTLSRDRGLVDRATAELVLIGFMGAFTTFSSYVNDLVGLAAGARFGALGLDFLLQNAGGVACYLAGVGLARLA
jgi:CrcB protein